MKKCKCGGNMTIKTVLVTVDGKEHAYPYIVCERCGASVKCN